MTRRPVTRNDVARLAGTSTAVVSYVVNDGPRPVSADAKKRVRAAIAKLGYRPNRLAQALRKRRSGLVGVILPDTQTPYFSALATAVESELFSRGLLAVIGSSGFDPEREVRYAEAFADAQVDGLLIASVGSSMRKVVAASPGTIPTVYIHRAGSDGSLPLVAHDDASAGEIATRHLFEHGHRAVACIAPPADGPIGDRVAGWKRALRARKVPYRDSMLVRAQNNRGDAARVVTEWLASHPQTSAIFASTDELAFGVIRAAASLGKRIPQDLALIGCDGLMEGHHSVPRLTSVRLSLDTLAHEAVVRLLEGGKSAGRITVPVELVRSESCGCHLD